ncbi:alpha/beta fold hydrolase [Glycomyces sp. TRM65418]|uniref:alpha/beta fold hydrolase n=1 Tax=Glycomyces sp. TRM65418 TaxID=2867006 RepID=UPI001CE6D5B2|nr:alpha/beta hydrolase [Glycomyces sp. TRM65418]MCC3762689.1 alpha/beta fold hydrolase [Glycomyces sp. TRM65418]QZD56724.1 alpha/beta fold hydrolase [Glycomyces sp. TRM65418]
MASNEKIHTVDGVDLCTETFGDPREPAVLLVHGAGHSMTAWPEALCRRIAAGSRFVIRYDGRDAGRSTGDEAGAPAYTLRDLVDDAAGLIDVLGLSAVHVVGMSQGAAVAQLLALDHRAAVATLTLASGTPGGPGHSYPDLPPPAPEIQALFTEDPPEVDWSDRAAAIEAIVEGERPYAARTRPFDEAAMRESAGRTFDRSADLAAQMTNPFLLDPGKPWRDRLGEIQAPTLVLHGTEDPMFPFGHGEALASEIPGARLIAMERTGHEIVPPPLWDDVVAALLAHTAER